MQNPNQEQIEFIKQLIGDLLKVAGFNATINYENSLANGLVFNISTYDRKLLIGKQGLNLQALQHIVFAIVNKQFKDLPVRFTLDIDDYLANRKYQLKQIVKDSVSELKHGLEYVLLPSLPRFERKFVHNYIQEQFPHLNTESVGVEPNRKIKIKI